jgi:hypothetical protein
VRAVTSVGRDLAAALALRSGFLAAVWSIVGGLEHLERLVRQVVAPRIQRWSRKPDHPIARVWNGVTRASKTTRRVWASLGLAGVAINMLTVLVLATAVIHGAQRLHAQRLPDTDVDPFAMIGPAVDGDELLDSVGDAVGLPPMPDLADELPDVGSKLPDVPFPIPTWSPPPVDGRHPKPHAPAPSQTPVATVGTTSASSTSPASTGVCVHWTQKGTCDTWGRLTTTPTVTPSPSLSALPAPAPSATPTPTPTPTPTSTLTTMTSSPRPTTTSTAAPTTSSTTPAIPTMTSTSEAPPTPTTTEPVPTTTSTEPTSTVSATPEPAPAPTSTEATPTTPAPATTEPTPEPTVTATVEPPAPEPTTPNPTSDPAPSEPAPTSEQAPVPTG